MPDPIMILHIPEPNVANPIMIPHTLIPIPRKSHIPGLLYIILKKDRVMIRLFFLYYREAVLGPMAILSIWTGLGPKVANSNEKALKVLERFWFPDLGAGD